ncbi:DUF1045 domain-containing protein [Pseudodesulfovibrio piezophilus]|uniref:Phosphonate metabolism protein n=1 Tax=Pseudodesulfovibrio piezophilus (strain DSM 21447 / JCM 15486 / C1TLV30) TaxID=1322246 RepID=M1WJH5_PSEP2|nr:DUF1045 domain-containing protein [Pseudodesulfovibrio piezophilus]CCH47906.1 conserved protein of unknown function [Pseudodesulfovibrio piezophilus C1TLV30]
MEGRFAVYFSPEKDSDLDQFGKWWLARCAESGQCFESPRLRTISSEDILRLTTVPRQYGFHGTLVAPFILSSSCTEWQLIRHATEFAQQQKAFFLEGFNIIEIGNFLALVPEDYEQINSLADSCVRAFDSFREQPTLAEMERRRAKGLTPVQERLLARWGYPFVLSEFHFHLTLTDSIRDRKMRKKLIRSLNDHTWRLRKQSHFVSELCLFYQQSKKTPFMLIHRIPFGKKEVEQ